MNSLTDEAALRRLLAYLRAALAEQEPHVRDQLDAALRQGDTAFRLEPSALGPVVVVRVGRADLLEVDLRNLVEQ